MIELGTEQRDKITGFKGVVVGFVTYLTGCNQALIVPKVKKDGSPGDAQWVDEQRLEQVGSKVIRLDNSKTPGFDKEPPKR